VPKGLGQIKLVFKRQRKRTFHRTRVVGIVVYDLANIVDLTAVDLVSTDIIESASMNICVKGVLEERH
jgi:hypothetical protein